VTNEDVNLQEESVSAHAGEGLAWLGGIPDREFDGTLVTIEQRVEIPPEATSITFSGELWLRTLETDPEAFDGVYVDLLTSDGNESLLWFVTQWTNLDAVEGWSHFEFVADPTEFAGQSVLLRLHSETDPERVTSFWFDSLSLVVSCDR